MLKVFFISRYWNLDTNSDLKAQSFVALLLFKMTTILVILISAVSDLQAHIKVEKEATAVLSKEPKKATAPVELDEGVLFTYDDKKAKTVSVAGTFNNWDINKHQLKKNKHGIWQILIPLPQGSIQYKLVIDGKDWVIDPNNEFIFTDADGNENSIFVVKKDYGLAKGPKQTPEGVIFTFESKEAKSVSLVGSFNNWDIKSNPMKKDEKGIWKTVLKLRPGKYEYKFVIDGEKWGEDPQNPNTVPDSYGGKNSVIVIKGKGGPQITPEGVKFTYFNDKAKTVNLAGSFNNWDKTKRPMVSDGKGNWSCIIKLAPGKHFYKFVIDDKTWVSDPENENTVDDGYGGFNSVVEVK